MNPSSGSRYLHSSQEGSQCSPSLQDSSTVGLLRYFDQILMEEEDLEPADIVMLVQESSDFRATERSFYDALGHKYPPSPQQHESSHVDDANNISSTTELGSGSRNHEITDPNKINPSSLQDSTVEMLRYFNHVLMESEDDLEPHDAMLLQESSDFRAEERSLYDALGQKYPPYPQHVDNDVSIREFDDSVWVYTTFDDEELAADMAKLEIMRPGILKPAAGSGGGAKTTRTTTKKRRNKNNMGGDGVAVIDLRALLTDCAKSASSGDLFTAHNLLRQIRQHSTPHGDGNQRLAHYFADGLEARLAGTGYLMRRITETPEYLRAYHVSNSSSMTRKIFSFSSNETIVTRSENAARIHVIDFGILYGIQWPSFIRRVAEREGGPPEKLRITGIEFPQAGLIIEDTGRRLARFAATLGVPFEYKAIAREWESVKTEDLGIQKGEFVAVVCSVRAMKLLDETVSAGKSPRARFLKLCREINPDVFVHMIFNGAYNQPYFPYRFRDLLLHHLSVFDMLETFIPDREKPERMMIERDYLGKDIMNVIACEGLERDKRPETYRQWQARDVKAGFKKVGFERKLVEAITWKVINLFHKDFAVSVENDWMIMSWKGRALYAISCWEPAASTRRA